MRLRPADAECMHLQPVKTTGKRGQVWGKIAAQGKERMHTPSTDKEVLGILAAYHKKALLLRDIRLIDQVTKSIYQSPKIDKKTKQEQVNARGETVYRGGLLTFVCADGRIRSHANQVQDTGRAAFARPPMQNFATRREADYARILGDRYHYPIKSIFISGVDERGEAVC